jgi:FolB domain-containing protein
MEDTVDYRAIKKRVLALIEASQFFLVEALAEAIADICLGDAKVQKAGVQVEKPSALRFARSVGVRITRERKHRP